MMNALTRIRLFVLLFTLVPSSVAQAASIDPARDALVVLSYHDVVNDLRGSNDRHAVTAAELVAHFTWLRANGYAVVSLDQVIAARSGGSPLPPRSVLLSFDDGYRSFYTRVFPLLKIFDYPAVLALVGSWLEVPAYATVPYEEGNAKPRSEFVSWDEVREIVRSGLVSIASHSYDLHHGVRANLEGNTQPAATTRIFDPASGAYESDDAYRTRIHADLARNSALIERELGVRPQAMVWPFGSYNHAALQVAAGLGMPVTLTLDDGLNLANVPLDRLRRVLIERNPTTQDLAWRLLNLAAEEPRRVVHVALDDIHDTNRALQEARLSGVLDRLHRMQVNTVVLQATSRTSTGVAAYFPNRHLPVRGDLLNRVAWQMISRLRVDVLVHLDVADVLADQVARSELFSDLGKHVNFSGLYFNAASHADATRLARAASEYRAPLRTVLAFGFPDRAASGGDGFTAALAGALREHDHVALGLNAGSDAATLRRAVDVLGSHQEGLQRTVIELHLPRAFENRLESSRQLAAQLTQLQRLGARNLGYRFDAPAGDFPALETVRGSLSLGAQLQ